MNPSVKGIGEYEDYFELTCEGEPMNLNEAAAWIVDNREPLEESKEPLQDAFKSSTHVLVIDDVYQGMPSFNIL